MAMNILKQSTRLIGSLAILLSTTLLSTTFAQTTNAYLITFKDKVGSSDAESTLSSKSLERRVKFSIPLNEDDKPVSTAYITQVLQDTSLHLRYSLKWHNGVVVNTYSSAVPSLTSLPFVENVRYVGKAPTQKDFTQAAYTTPVIKLKESQMSVSDLTEADYGFAYAQNKQIGAPYLHAKGLGGEGIDVAVFDAGFRNLPLLPAFIKHQANHKLTLVYDISELDNMLTDNDNHGTAVSSCFAAYDKGKYIGSAPLSHIWLFGTEYAASEYPIEELNWCKAAELADSIGIDMITSSLGYNKYDDASLSYTYQSLDGNTSYISLGARTAVEKGILVLNSAGNEGDNAWRKIGTPADVPTVLTIGAVSTDNKLGSFTSQGYNANGVIKPDVAACGVLAYVASTSGGYYQGYGTSYATPVAAGGVACLLQAFPQLTPAEINKLIRSTATQAQYPDSTLGYGIAQFDAAYNLQQCKNLQSNVPEIIKVNEDQLIVYNGDYEKLSYDIYLTIKLFRVFNIKRHLKRGELTALQEVSFIDIHHKRASCSKKYTISIQYKSNVGNYELINNDLELCSL
jgi:serine protease AprX